MTTRLLAMVQKDEERTKWKESQRASKGKLGSLILREESSGAKRKRDEEALNWEATRQAFPV